jgi:hypothetical protein
MGSDGIGAPLSRRVPGAARLGPGQAVPPVLPESVLNRMQAAIDAEHAQAEVRGQGEPNTEPLPRVTVSGSPGKHVASPAASPSGVLPDTEVQQDRAARPERVARPPRAAKPLRAEEPLRIAKALRAGEELRAAAAARVLAAEPEPPSAAELEPPSATEPGPVHAAEPEPVYAAEASRPAEPPYPAQPSRAAEPPGAMRPTVTPAFETGPTPGSIGWLWPEETAQRGGGGPRWQPPRRWRYRTATLVAAAAVVLAGAGLFVGMSLHSTPVVAARHGTSRPKATARPTVKAQATPAATPTPAAPDPAIAASVTAAAAWVAQQVAPGTVVACDVQTCAALTASGFPVAQQIPLAVNPQSLAGARIVVVTPALRTLFTTTNPALGNYVIPAVLASFGPVSIHVVYPAGRAAYQTALNQEVKARIQLGEQLLNSGRVSASPAAETALADGDVDSRLLLAIQALANLQPVNIVNFGGAGSGGGPATPFLGAQLGETDPFGGIPSAVYVQAMISLLMAHATFPAFATGKQVTLVTGQNVVQVQYAAPSPLGLLGS